jgi:hypothetical protein
MAEAMQCNPIVVVGQDLAFPNNKIYAGGMELTTDDKGRMVIETTESVQGGSHEMCEVQGQNGETLQTIKPYKTIVRHFEELAQGLKRNGSPIELYNASLGGAHIEGYALKPLGDFVGQFPSWKETFALPEVPVLDGQDAELRKENLFRGLVEIERDANLTLAVIEETRRNLRNEKRHGRGQEAFNKANKRMFECVTRYEFIGFTLLFEMLNYKERIVKADKDPGKMMEILETLLNNSDQVLREKILPWIRQSQRALAGVTENSPTGEYCSA